MSDSEVSAVISELQQLMGALRVNVTALESILTDTPEVTGDQPAPA